MRTKHKKFANKHLLTKKDITRICNSSSSKRDCLRKLGFSDDNGHHEKWLDTRMAELNISKPKHWRVRKIPLKELLTENSSAKTNKYIKSKLIQENILVYKCNICGIDEWNNQVLILQLDHINGNNRDYRLDNLQLLCPNCHSQTDNFAGRKTKATYPSKLQLSKLVHLMSVKNISLKFGMSISVAADLISFYKIKLPPPGYWHRKR